jgi:glycerate dehydrogenase
MSAYPLKTVFLDYDTVSNGDLDLAALREAAGDLILHDSSETQIAERMSDADIVLLNKLELTRELLSDAPRLKLVALAATGTNNVDLAAARERGIAVCNVRAYCTASVVQHVWGLILSLTQHVYEFSRLSRDGSWTKDEAGAVLSHPIRELQGRIFGVVGWGELGRGAARIAEAFGMQVSNPRHDRCARACADEARRIADQYGARRADRRSGAGRRPQGGAARRRRHRCSAAGAAGARRAALGRSNSESIGDAAHRLGGA